MPEWSRRAPGESRVLIQDLCLRVRLGVGEAERATPQRLLISLDLEVEPALPRDDDVTSVVDYGVLLGRVRALAARETQLLETWVQWIAEACFADPRVRSATIALVKPDIYPDSVRVGIRQTVAREE